MELETKTPAEGEIIEIEIADEPQQLTQDDQPAKTEEARPSGESTSAQPAPESGDATETEEGGYLSLSPEERDVYGKRAQKRIKALLGQTKAAAAAIQERDAELARLRQELEVQRSAHIDTQVNLIAQAKARVSAEEAEATEGIRRSRESGDIEAEIKYQNALAATQAHKLAISQAETQLPAREKPAQQPQQPQMAPQKPPAQSVVPRKEGQIDKNAVAWYKRNLWFGGTAPKERVMTAIAKEIHEELVSQGINPIEDADEYYTTLDKRMASEFPEDLKPRTEPKREASPVSAPSRTSGNPNPGRNKVTLTPSEVALAGRLGLTNEQYAREKLKLARPA